MRARDFAFWLQGYFEVTLSNDALDAAQAKQVLAKLEKIETGNDATEQAIGAYANFAKGLLSTVEYIAPEDQAKMLTGITAKLRSGLGDLFANTIDPAKPGDQQRNKPRPDDDRPRVVAMC